MTHLTPDQFVDALEGRPESHAARTLVEAHVAECATCRQELETLTEVMQTARGVEMPEPSPLFWDHFSRRVNAAVAHETVPASGWRGRLADAWRPLALFGVACAALVIAVTLRPQDRPVPVPVATTADAVVMTSEGNDEALNMLAIAAQDLRSDELQQAVRPSADATGAAFADLTPNQLAELERLIKSKTGGAE